VTLFVAGLFVCRLIRPLAQSLPEINLDAFKICFYKRWHLGELLFTNLVMVFGMPSPSNPTLGSLTHFTPHCTHNDITDLLAFSIIFTISRRPGTRRHPGVSKILDTIVQDATVYFIFMFVCQLLLEFFLIFAPVSDILMCPTRMAVIHVVLTLICVQEEIQPMPGV